MWLWIVLGLLGLSLVLGAAYYWAQRSVQQRALRALRWIENSLGNAGHVSGMRWLSDSRFEVPLKVAHPIFQRPYIQVELAPLSPALGKNDADTLTFIADLDVRPVFSMSFENLRWFARTRRDISADSPGWKASHYEPVVLTTRLDWDRGASSAIQTVLHCSRREDMKIHFRRNSPNFSATLPLNAISPEHPEPLELLTVMLGMAEGIQLKNAS